MKLVKELSTGETQDYVHGIEYADGALEAIYFDDGRAILKNNAFEYQFKIADHLGSNRVMFKDNGNGVAELLQQNHYYGFGAEHYGEWNATISPLQKQLYNNKVLTADFGLNWYFYGARMFDPLVCRFTGVDPISDQFPHVSTYNYAENSPIANIDLHGLQKFNVTQFDRNRQNLTKEGKAAFEQE